MGIIPAPKLPNLGLARTHLDSDGRHTASDHDELLLENEKINGDGVLLSHHGGVVVGLIRHVGPPCVDKARAIGRTRVSQECASGSLAE